MICHISEVMTLIYITICVLHQPPVRGGPYYPAQDPMYPPQGPPTNWMTPPGGQPSYRYQNQPVAPGMRKPNKVSLVNIQISGIYISIG